MQLRQRWTWELVREFYHRQGCFLLESVYCNSKTPMRYVCKCGNVHTNSFSHFVDGQRCKVCAGNAPYTQKDMKRIFRENGCELLSDYRGFSRKVTYRCSCGNVAEISPSKFKAGQRCRNCMGERKKALFMARYGVPNPALDPNIRAKQHATNRERYGVSMPLQNLEIRRRAHATIKAKYGVSNTSEILPTFSKESQRLFWQVYKRLPPEWQTKTYFAELNQEFSSQTPHFRYDFVVSCLKRCIEYHGSAWHPPDDCSDDVTGWHVRDKTLRAGDARARERLKEEQLLRRGFTFLTIWDNEFHKDPTGTVDRCLSFLRK